MRNQIKNSNLFKPIDISNRSDVENFKSKGKQFLKDTNKILLINFGGDGSLFSALSTVGQIIQPSKTIILTIPFNFGNKGFYCFYTKEQLKDFIEKRLDLLESVRQNFENKNYLEGFFWKAISEDNREHYFLGDIVIKAYLHYKTIKLGYTIEDVKIEEIADGIIIFTCFGATGYFLSLNGTYIDPFMKDLIGITFIAPHSLKHRPLLFHNKEIIITNEDNKNAVLITDGQDKLIIEPKQQIKITKTDKKFILLGEKNIFKRWIKMFY